ncbi:helix-turn-helix transcriptional regulator [Novosphingobium taihuense]|uniref:Transcriptional regulator with XRE-family HTH domain n=1 Tax=Novosphingobium taihuense TaxID=260085 RepID=A0A7W7EVR8_9SPHN|nr:helix-turn-helix transcriptional regulator [Novosphingobium taihuense]MBB4615753.1 transcriptional regulator with XRE-family HTH domain [Novosphingobium taihuense]
MDSEVIDDRGDQRDMVRSLIKAEMAKRGWSQSDLARETGLPRYTISRILRGETAVSPAVGHKIGLALKLEGADLSIAFRRPTAAPIRVGYWSNQLSDGSTDVRFSGNLPRGVSLAVEALINLKRPISIEKLARIIQAIAAD